MAKFAILLLAAVAVHGNVMKQEEWGRQQEQVQWMYNNIRELTNDVATNIENAQVDTVLRRRSMITECNEFAHGLDTVVYKMQRAVQDVEGEDKKFIQQIANKLSEIAYKIQQAMNAEPTQMKTQLKAQIQKVVEEVHNLNQRFQQTQQPQEGKCFLVNIMKRAIFGLQAALRKIKVHAELYDKTTQEVFTKMQTVANDMPMYMQHIKVDDAETAEELADFIQRLSRHMTVVVDKLQREAINHEGETKNTMYRIATKLSEMRTNLEQVANTESNTQEWIKQMKERITTTVRDVVTHIQKLVQVAQQSKDQEGHGIRAVIKNVIVDVMSAFRTMQVQLNMTTEPAKRLIVRPRSMDTGSHH